MSLLSSQINGLFARKETSQVNAYLNELFVKRYITSCEYNDGNCLTDILRSLYNSAVVKSPL